jgi:hypothetical protein
VAGVILLVLFLLRPGASRLKSRIVLSISSAVGRSVDIGSVHIRLLPRPGFDLDNLVVYDDPAFGAEPILRAGEVTAYLRLFSLMRGRLEIARLDLTDPSLNLVHGQNGRWNLEALLERTAHTPLAPTAKAKSEPRPAFPYIEGTSARINFKNGPEKKPYALTNADFSLWQDSENTWGVRLKAQPIRTDLNLNDTGMLQVNGTWQRADNLRNTPLKFAMQWDRAQLGQLTKFFTGSDQGWRGAVELDISLAGTPENLQVASDFAVRDFRRYDINSGEPLRLAAHCGGQYSSSEHIFHELSCKAPVEKGSITLTGEMGLPGSHNYNLVLASENVPASLAALLVERTKKNLPDDLAAAGMLNGRFSFMHDAASSKVQFEGQGEISDFQLASASNKAQIGPETVHFLLNDSNSASPKRAAVRKPAALTEGPRVEFGPLSLAAGRPSGPAVRGWVIQGWINRTAYNISVTGDAEIARTLRLARMVGLPALQSATEGTAQLDLQIAGAWAGLISGSPSAPQVSGTAKLRNVRVAVRGAGGPVEIASADLRLSSDGVRVEKLVANAAGASWTGSLDLPRGCGTPDACQAHFTLNATPLALSALHEWASPHPKEHAWYQVLASSASSGPSFLGSLRASGRVITDRFQLKNFAATRVSANVTLDRGKLEITDLAADFLGGKHRGEWQADFTAKPGVCSGSGTLTNLALAQLDETTAGKMEKTKAPWIAGTATASYEVKGECPAEFWPSAEGKLVFDLRDGILPHISLAENDEPLKISRLSGQAHLHGGKLEMKDAVLDSSSGKFQLNGTASLNRELDLKLARPANAAPGGFTITGTIAAPRVEPLSGPVQARLKP